ncbi:PLC-like phosphodiesterase [Coniochaeta hoffmannii]|uniref:PLC-like phosphodiesterase n=1 Tax=Coniochaeta hoffmannii TaxID=91930 RepID=A0AA38SEL0_9PEZI|nr:PLC-like phosphodiesterase [Coniochaeta hoffmannii]
MVSPRVVGLACFLLLSPAVAQLTSSSSSTSTSTSTDGITLLTGTKTPTTASSTPTPTYSSPTSKVTLASSSSGATSVVQNATAASADTTTVLTGSAKTSTTLSGNGTATVTSSSEPEPTNTTPCNNYPEFCARRYSNITMVAAHNSPFIRPGSAAANQEYPVATQLDDGIRLVQAQIQWPVNGTEPHFCHTSCDILDAGPITSWLTDVKNWVASHPYDVVTILLGNGNYSTPDKYVPYIESTGILAYAYTPPVVPMNLTDWPPLSQMILRGQRVVFFLDYNANQTAYPWLLDQFSQMWETPFDPVDPTFPCTVQRPPDLAPDQARARLYMANHNLNAEVSLLGTSLLVPAVSLLNRTNAANGTGSLGAAAEGCNQTWGRPPNFLNVDYYNFGSPNGSVFEVAARMNNVTYNRPCCGGVGVSGAARAPIAARDFWLSIAIMVGAVFAL